MSFQGKCKCGGTHISFPHSRSVTKVVIHSPSRIVFLSHEQQFTPTLPGQPPFEKDPGIWQRDNPYPGNHSVPSYVRLCDERQYLLLLLLLLIKTFLLDNIRLHNEELHSLYRSPNIVRVIKSRRLRWAGHVARMEEGMNAFKILTGKPTGKRPLGRPRCRCLDNI